MSCGAMGACSDPLPTALRLLEYRVATPVDAVMLADLLDFAGLIAEAITSRRPRFWLSVLLLCVVAFVVIVIVASE